MKIANALMMTATALFSTIAFAETTISNPAHTSDWQAPATAGIAEKNDVGPGYGTMERDVDGTLKTAPTSDADTINDGRHTVRVLRATHGHQATAKSSAENSMAASSTTTETTHVAQSGVATHNEHSASGAAAPIVSEYVAAQGQSFEVVEFGRGSAALSEAGKAKLQALVDNARTHGQIDKMHVAVWSDRTFPGAKGEKRSRADRDLAKNRIESIRAYLKNQLNVASVETYNMAQRSNWFARAFNTNQAELKSLFAQQGAPKAGAQEFRIVREHGAPMKAVVLLEMDEKAQNGPAAK